MRRAFVLLALGLAGCHRAPPPPPPVLAPPPPPPVTTTPPPPVTVDASVATTDPEPDPDAGPVAPPLTELAERVKSDENFHCISKRFGGYSADGRTLLTTWSAGETGPEGWDLIDVRTGNITHRSFDARPYQNKPFEVMEAAGEKVERALSDFISTRKVDLFGLHDWRGPAWPYSPDARVVSEMSGKTLKVGVRRSSTDAPTWLHTFTVPKAPWDYTENGYPANILAVQGVAFSPDGKELAILAAECHAWVETVQAARIPRAKLDAALK